MQPIIGEFYVDKNEHTLPMVPAGAKLHDMVLCTGQVWARVETQAESPWQINGDNVDMRDAPTWLGPANSRRIHAI